MTQYRTELCNALKRSQEKQEKVDSLLTHLENLAVKENTINIFLTDMDKESDSEILAASLLSMQGIKRVKPAIPQKRLSITYNPQETTPHAIAHYINRLGYHHIGRG